MSDEKTSETTAPDDLKARAEALVGTTISQRYRIDALIAFGGMGAVYRGEHILMRKRIAVKLLQSGAEDLPQLVERFRREAIVGAHVTHPNIASATDFGELDDGSYFLVMEHIKGRTLYDLIKEEGALPLDRAMGIARQVAAGLAAAHEAGVVHRDLKPHNIMLVDLDGNRTASVPALLLGRDIIKIIDFGFASMAEERLSIAPSERPSVVPDRITQQGEIFGTIAYLAPEAAAGMDVVDARSDLYALGVVIYQMLTGLHPFKETAPGPLFRCHLTKPPPPFKVRAPEVDVPAAVEAITMRLLEKEPERRFQNAPELIEAIDEAMGLTGLVALAPGRISSPAIPADLLAGAFQQEAEAAAARERSSTGHSATSLLGPSSLSGSSTSTSTSTSSSALMAADALRISAAPPVAPSKGWIWGVLAGVGMAVVVGGVAWNQGLIHLAPAATAQAAGVSSGNSPGAPASVAPPALVASAPPEKTPPTPPANSGEQAANTGPKEDVTPWKIRLKSSVQVHDWPNARLSFRRVAELDPDGLADSVFLPTVVDFLTNLGQHQDAEVDQIFGLLENKTGSAGLDVLYDVVQRRGGSLAATRAAEILKKPIVLARASAPMRIAFELRMAPCEKKASLLPRAESEGDWRILQVFDSMRSACGQSKTFDEVRRKIAMRQPR